MCSREADPTLLANVEQYNYFLRSQIDTPVKAVCPRQDTALPTP